MAAPRRGTRSYRTDLRAKQAAETRAAIVSALLVELARAHEAREELSVARVADRAGVSLRTVYHHFPDRETQLAAIASQLDTHDPQPRSLADLPVYAARLAHQMLANPIQTRAEVALDRPRRARDAAIHRAVAKQTEPGPARLVGAALAAVLSPELVITLLDRHRLDPVAVELVLTWLVQVIVDATRNGDLPSSPTKRTRRS